MATNDFDPALTDTGVLLELGERLSRRRIDRGLTQAQLAKLAGVGKRTVERMEAGSSTQLLSFIRVLRILGLLDGLDLLVPESGPRPMEALERKPKQRQRASGKASPQAPNKGWSWGDES